MLCSVTGLGMKAEDDSSPLKGSAVCGWSHACAMDSFLTGTHRSFEAQH